MNNTNPIIPGFSPDPSVVLVDGTYFLVNSTFHLYPGLPIYTSSDLVHWKHIGNAINRPEQLSLKTSSTLIHSAGEGDYRQNLLATGGLYAPTIRHHNGAFYVICTNVIHSTDEPPRDTANFIVSTKDIWKGEWSNPVPFDFKGIDPSLFFDGDGKVYMCGSAHPGPMTTIVMFEIDVSTGKHLSEDKVVWRGTGGIFPEGPHTYFRNSYYYLFIAEGGTHEGHSMTLARSKNIWGPYESCPRNPVLTARDTDEYVQCTGHCEAFEGIQGEWWGVCLGIRMKKKEEERYVMGRETFLTKAKWSDDGWLEFERASINVDVPGVKEVKENERLTAVLGVDFLYIRDPKLSSYNISDDYKTFKLTASTLDLDAPEESPTFLGKRQRLIEGRSSVAITGLEKLASTRIHSAGLTIYKDEHRYLRVFYNPETSAVGFEVRNKSSGISRSSNQPIDGSPKTLRFLVEYTEMEIRMSYSVDGKEHKVLDTADTMELSGKDFVGPIVGMFVTGEDGEVVFEDFEVA